MKTNPQHRLRHAMAAALTLLAAGAHTGAHAGVTAEQAAQLKTTLTPMGAERAANKDGTIPAWTGAPTANAALTPNGRRADPFAGEKPLFSINAKNMAEYADRLTEGTKAMLKKYPDFRVDVYKTHRSAIAPQWVYDATAKNALAATLAEGAAGPEPKSAFGGVPFPIPKTGAEVMWNHKLAWRGTAWYWEFHGYQLSADGRWILAGDTANDQNMPYYAQGGSADKFNGEYWLVRSLTRGPAIRAGEAITGRLALDENKTSTWVYLTGQRRVRKLPNPCCDTPTPAAAGVMSFDEIEVFTGRLERFAGYALEPHPGAETLRSGESLVGQAVRTRSVHWVREVPEGYLSVSSATGTAQPRELLIAPALYAGRVYAVVELGFFRTLSAAGSGAP